MNVEEILGEILDRAEKLNEYWDDNKISQKKIRKDVEFNFFKNKKSQFSTRFAYFYAFQIRTKKRYNNIFKALFRYFAWKKDTKLLSKMKTFLDYQDNSNTELILKKEVQKFFNGENRFGRDGNNKDGKNLKNDKKNLNIGQKNQLPNQKNEQTKNLDETNKNDLGYEDEKQEDRKTVTKDAKFEPNINDKNPESLSDKGVAENAIETEFAERDLQTREHLEVSRDDLTNFETNTAQHKPTYIDQMQKVTPLGSKSNNEPTHSAIESERANPQGVSAQSTTKQEMRTAVYSGKMENNRTTANNVANKTQNVNVEIAKNAEQKLDTREKFVITQNDKNPEPADIPLIERHDNDPDSLADQMEALTEQNIQDIKSVVEQHMEEQSRQAIEQGDFDKMSINLQKAYGVEHSERSSVQVNKSANVPNVGAPKK